MPCIDKSEEEQSLLFKEFSRIKSDKTKNISGSGPGLFIMKKVLDLNNGVIGVESRPDMGCTFTVRLNPADCHNKIDGTGLQK